MRAVVEGERDTSPIGGPLAESRAAHETLDQVDHSPLGGHLHHQIAQSHSGTRRTASAEKRPDRSALGSR